MIVLSGATLVLPDRLLSPGTLVIDEGRIAEIRPDAPSGGQSHSLFAFHGHYIVPGFVPTHSLTAFGPGNNSFSGFAAV